MARPSPASKTVEIQSKLVSYWNTKETLSELEFRILEQQANSIQDHVERHDTLGMLYAIQKKDNLMQEHYEEALSSVFHLGVLCNFLSSLSRRNLFEKQKDIIYAYQKDLTDLRSLKNLIEVASMFLDYDMACFAHQKLLSIGGENRFVLGFQMRTIQIGEILRMTNCTTSQINILVNVCSRILRQHGVSSSALHLDCIAGGHYVMDVDTNDIDVIVDMNFELADQVVLIPELDNCKLIAMFRPAKIGDV